MFFNPKLALLSQILFLSLSLTACGDKKTYRDVVSNQNDSFTQAKNKELQPAEATYQGVVHITDSNEDFDCVIEVKRTSEFTRLTQSQDQTETVEVPKLGGSVRFPILKNVQMEDLSSYSSLTTPMGGYLTVMFDFGNYNPRNKKLILPYTVPAYADHSFGEFNGTLTQGHYKGTWFSKPLGNIGTFDLIQVASSEKTTVPVSDPSPTKSDAGAK